MGFFDDEMPEIKLGDIDNIPCSSRRVGGGRARKDRKYPNRDGQSSEDMGREPYTFDLEIPLFAGVDPNHYPSMADAIRSLLDDPPAQLEYRDHELGTMHVSIDPWTSEITAEKRDGCVFRIKLTEDDLDAGAAFRETTPQPNAEDAGATLDAELAEAGVDETDTKAKLDQKGVGLTGDERSFSSGSMWSTQATRVIERINDGVATAEQIAAVVDTMRGRTDVLLGLPQLQNPANGSAVTAAILFLDAIVRLGDVASASAAIEVEEELLDVLTVFDVASRLYGDEQRAAEIMQRNPLVNGLFLPRGTRLRVASQ